MKKKAGIVRTDLVCGTLSLSILSVLSLLSVALYTLFRTAEYSTMTGKNRERIRMTVSGVSDMRYQVFVMPQKHEFRS